jgi:beta-lactamase superfamily II metal-dependent hydrolase
MELDGLSEGADITVNTRGTLSAPSDRIEEYQKYFTTFTDTHSLKVVNNALQYEIDFEAYMTPFIRDVSAEAIADGKIHYYFMSTEGFVTSPTAADNIYKWGDSCLIVFPNGETMLVDTGYSMQQPWLIGNLKRMGVGSEENPLDYLLITHPHSDHQGAFYSPYPFFDEIKVTQVYHNKLRVDSASTDEYVENVCAARNLPLMDLKQGTELDFGDVHMEVLWPAPAMATTNIGTGKINDNSMVFRLDYGEHSALFTADIYTLAEGQILETVDSAKLDVDFLKVPHHGWNTSSSEVFVKAVSAKLAVATGRVDISEGFLNTYTSAGTELLMDLYRGYIHVAADAEGNMTYETSR